MSDTIFDDDRLDVYRLWISSTGYQARVDDEHEHRFAEHKHKKKSEPEDACEWPVASESNG